MSNKQARNRRKQVMLSIPHLTLINDEDQKPKSKKARREQARLDKCTVVKAVSEQSVPEGSLLSESTLELIRSGQTLLKRMIPKDWGKSPVKAFRTPSDARRYGRRHPLEDTLFNRIAYIVHWQDSEGWHFQDFERQDLAERFRDELRETTDDNAWLLEANS